MRISIVRKATIFGDLFMRGIQLAAIPMALEFLNQRLERCHTFQLFVTSQR
jgi:hypothetical protein